MELSDAIYARASVRAFADEPVSDEQVERLLRAAMAAPSAGNQQPWSWHLTRDPDLRAALAAASPYAAPAARAPLVIVPCMVPGRARHADYCPQDLSAAVENLLLAAVGEGLGAVWMGIAPEPERMAAVSAALGLLEGEEPFALVAVGVPARDPRPTGAGRYDPALVTWH